MKTTNPVISNLSNQELPTVDSSLTIDDIVQKTGITLAIIVAFAALNFGIAVTGYQSLAMILTIVGAIGGFIAVLV